jgi:hypothetical protein
VERLKVARTFRVDPRNPLVPGLLGQAILEAFQNQDLSEMAQQLAPAFAHRLDERPSEIVADLVGELI